MSLTPPVSRDDFHFANGDFYVSPNPQNRHRRATVPELQALFHPTPGQLSARDPPAHWYKAQLLHYGLNPTNAKGTAVKRLLDAVNTGKLDVPAHLRKLELDLKKKWDSNERKAKRAINAAAKDSGPPKTKAKKRKANDEDTVGVNGCITPGDAAGFEIVEMKLDLDTNSNGAEAGVDGEAVGTPGKKRKTKKNDKPKSSTKGSTTGETEPQRAKKSSSETKEGETKKKPKAQNETIVKKETKKKSKTKIKNKTESSAGEESNGKKKHEAKSNSDPAVKKERKAKAEPKPKVNGDLTIEDGSHVWSGPEPEPAPHATPETEISPQVRTDPTDKPESPVEHRSPGGQPHSQISPPSIPPLGLLNGRYDVSFSNDNYGDMILCLHGKSVWGDFCVPGAPTRGVFYLPERPWCASPATPESFSFTWRGVDDHGVVRCGRECTGWIVFLSGGRIAGNFRGLDRRREMCEFQGRKISCSQARPPRVAPSMEDGFHYYGSH